MILVDEISGGYGAGGAGMTLIRGRLIPTQQEPMIYQTDNVNESASIAQTEVKFLLAGTGIVDGVNRAKKLEVGMRIGVRGPNWEIVVEGETWQVAVNWRVL